MVLAPEGSKILSIVEMLVAPAFKDSGMREKLLQHALEDAKKKGYTHAEVYLLERMHTDKEDFQTLLTMYERAGFRIIRNLSGIDGLGRHFIMQKRIDDECFSERATRFVFGDYVIDVDVDKTREIYKGFASVTERCRCDACENYQKAIERVPVQVKNFFECLGVDLGKITESVMCHQNRDGSWHYGCTCHVCGKVIKGKNLTVVQDGQLVTMRSRDAYEAAENVLVWFGDECTRVEKAFDAPVMQIDFGIDLPWALNQKAPEFPSYII